MVKVCFSHSYVLWPLKLYEEIRKYGNYVSSNLDSELDELRIKTKCGVEWAGTWDRLSLKFCNDGNCCFNRGIRSRTSLDMNKILDFDQNLHWKLGQQAPSVGTILTYLETTAKEIILLGIIFFLFFKIESWNFQHLFEKDIRNMS